MGFYVLLWDPSSSKNSDQQKQKVSSWSCGNAKGISVGDTVLLRKTGLGDRGIVAVGSVRRGSYEAHWSSTGEPGLFVDVDWSIRSNRVLIDRDDPDWQFAERLWTSQSGGIRIDDEVGSALLDELERRHFFQFLPTARQFTNYWKQHPPTNTQKEMLVTHRLAPGGVIHPRQMARTMGWPNQATAHLQYGKLAAKVIDEMGVQMPAERHDKVALFASWVRTPQGVQWILHKQVLDAIDLLGWLPLENEQHGDNTQSDADEQRRFAEGRKSQKLVTFRERHTSVRDHCLSIHPHECAVCKVNPGMRFGVTFDQMLEVHHLDPIADSADDRETNPQTDCRLLCPSCHRLAHFGLPSNECRSIEELKQLVSASRRL